MKKTVRFPRVENRTSQFFCVWALWYWCCAVRDSIHRSSLLSSGYRERGNQRKEYYIKSFFCLSFSERSWPSRHHEAALKWDWARCTAAFYRRLVPSTCSFSPDYFIKLASNL
jgi:hypothetical protein